MRLSKKDREAVKYLMIAQVAMVHFEQKATSAVEFKKGHDKEEMTKYRRQSRLILSQLDSMGEKLTRSVSNKNIESIMRDAEKVLKVLDGEQVLRTEVRG